MRMFSKLLAGSAAAAAVVALTAGPALADPPSGTTPKATNAVSVGAQTTENLFDQFTFSYDKNHPAKEYSWDATNPTTGAIGDQIETKSKCATIARPNGGGAGIAALELNTADPSSPGNFCIDYARTSSGRTSSNPPCAAGGICFVSLAGDAVTWAARNAASGGTDAPASLTTTQLAKIFECTITNWKQVGGKSAPIQAFLPQTSAATRTFWLTALGGGVTPITPGACVSDLPTSSEPGGTLEENEGINPALNSAGAIYIYSVGDYLAQAFHSAACTNSSCTGNPACTPSSTQNKFGCDETGVLGLGEISKSKPTAPWPPVKASRINSKFSLLYQRTLYDVVRFDSHTADHIPGGESGSPGGINLEQFLAAKTASTPGWVCSNSTARSIIANYGFLATWPLSICGAVS
jgi:ABC-type phosphate transport system substrate-binding protein